MSLKDDPQFKASSDLNLETVLVLIGAAVGAVSLGIINPNDMVGVAITWLVDRGALINSEDAVLALGRGAGLGWRHLAIVGCAAVAALAVLRLRRRRGDDSTQDRK